MTVNLAKDIAGWCTQCKSVLAHTIEAVVGGKITRVHCNSCGHQHPHRKSPPGRRAATTATARSASAAAREQESTPARQYEALVRGRTAAVALPYSTTARFKVGDLVSHATFGLGAITGERENVKIDVLFADGRRTLVHRGAVQTDPTASRTPVTR